MPVIAQLVECILGKDEVAGSIPAAGSSGEQTTTRRSMKKPITVFGIVYPTVKAGVFAYLDIKKVFTGTVSPPSYQEFNEETGNNLVHGCYGARLDEYCIVNHVDRIKLKTGVASPRFIPTRERPHKKEKPAKSPAELPTIKKSGKKIRVGNLLISKDTKRDPEFETFLNEKSPVIQAFFMDLRREYTRRCGRHPGDVKVINTQTTNGSHETVVVRGVEQYVLNNKRGLK